MKRFCSMLLSLVLLFTMLTPSAAAVDDFIVIPWGDDQTATQPETPVEPAVPETPSAPIVVPTIPLEPENSVKPVAPSEPLKPEKPVTPAKTYKATRSNMMISVDGKMVEPAGYAIEGYTYYKLRDVAYLMIGKPCTFAVGWDQPTYSVTMTTGKDYVPAGGELKKESASTATAKVGDCNLLLDGHGRNVQDFAATSMKKWKAQVATTLKELFSQYVDLNHQISADVLINLNQSLHEKIITFNNNIVAFGCGNGV